MNRRLFLARRGSLHGLLLVVALVVLSSSRAIAGKRVVLISCDGFRSDYTSWYDTPFLDRMARQGMSAELVPSFPSKTFPNHYTLATGLRPEAHGIIANSFIDRKTGARFSLGDPKTKHDPKFYGGEPLWLKAQHNGKHAAVFYWPGSDVAVQGEYPDKWYNYESVPRLTFAQRADGILEQLTRKGHPDLVMAYFEEPDHSGHDYGPQGKPTRRAVEQMDSLLAALWTRIGQAGLQDSTDLIVVSDHGMTWFTPERQIRVSPLLKASWYDRIEGNLPANIYAPKAWQQDSIMAALKGVAHLHAWRKKDIPARLHYQANDNIGDIVVLPDLGYLFTDEKCHPGGVHGYDPAYNDMHALFRAIGPDFPKGQNAGMMDNTEVYPLVCKLLGIR